MDALSTVPTPRPGDSLPAWHFLAADGCLSHGDGRPVEVGSTLSVQPTRPISLSHHGLHGCVHVLDALRLAPGPVLCRVVLSGELQIHGDIVVARHRRVLWMADSSPLLHRFAVQCAQQAFDIRPELDARLSAGLRAKQDWLMGTIDDDALNLAWQDAWSAAHETRGPIAWATAMAVVMATSPFEVLQSAWQASQEAIQAVLLARDAKARLTSTTGFAPGEDPTARRELATGHNRLLETLLTTRWPELRSLNLES